VNPDLFFGTVNTEVEIELADHFGVRSIPTLIIIKNGTIIYDEAGSIPEYALKNIVEKARTIDPEKL
jgi:thioredoxin 1